MQSLQVTSNFYSFTLKTWISSFPFKYLRLTPPNLQLEAQIQNVSNFPIGWNPLPQQAGLQRPAQAVHTRLHEPWNMPRVTTIFPQRGGEKKRQFLESIASHYYNYAKSTLNHQLGMPPPHLVTLVTVQHYKSIHLPGTRIAVKLGVHISKINFAINCASVSASRQN